MATTRTDARSFGRNALLGVATFVLLMLALVFPVGAKAADKGVAADLTWGISDADQDRTAAAMSDVGAKWVRISANWADAEPTKGQYNDWWLKHYDRAISLARNAGAKVVVMSYQSPSWASGSSVKETAPKNPADYANYMRFLATRYAGKVDAYEVWNEENIDRFWSTGANAAEYVSLLKPTYSAIKSADPNAKVVFGGLSTNDYSFVESAYAAGAKGYFDVMNVHPYSCSTSPDVVRRDGNGRITRDSYLGYREVRSSMVAAGDAKPIWFTEFGWSTTTGTCGVSESTQASYLTKAFQLAEQDSYVQVALWYNFRNNSWNHDADELEARYGLMRTDFSTKPAYQAFKSYVPGSGSTAGTSPASGGKKKRSTRTKLSITGAAKASSTKRARGSRRAGRKMLLGRVSGATSGHALLNFQRFNSKKHKWSKKVVRKVSLSKAGSFERKLGSLAHGKWRVRASYAGGADCESSASKTLKFKV
jgi:polysaccharide biosynthesis protein PslG